MMQFGVNIILGFRVNLWCNCLNFVTNANWRTMDCMNPCKFCGIKSQHRAWDVKKGEERKGVSIKS